jgi:hypothetical protein
MLNQFNLPFQIAQDEIIILAWLFDATSVEIIINTWLFGHILVK